MREETNTSHLVKSLKIEAERIVRRLDLEGARLILVGCRDGFGKDAATLPLGSHGIGGSQRNV